MDTKVSHRIETRYLGDSAVSSADGQKIPFRIRPSIPAIALRLLPYFVMLACSFVILHPLTRYFAELGIPILHDDLINISRVFRIVLVLELIRRHLNFVYVFGRKRIEGHYGCLSTNYRVSNIRYSDIREIKIEQGVLGRLFRFGTLQIGTASTQDYELALYDVNFPVELSDWIHKHRSELKRQGSITAADDRE